MAMAMEHNSSVKNADCFVNVMVWGISNRISARKSVGEPLFGRPVRDGKITLW
jgi:hypothetical protein